MTANDVVVTRRGETISEEGVNGRRDVASMQKSIVSVLVGIAIAQGALALDDTVTEHLGPGWTGRDDVPTEGEITLRHLLSMSSGLGDALEFVAKPGERWDYNLIVYPTTKRVLRAALGRPLNDVTAEWITRPLGMTESAWEDRVWDGSLPAGWKPAFVYPDGTPMEAFVSTPRDWTVFGNAVMHDCRGLGVDEAYRVAMTQPSQPMNPAYGLLWWVNSGAFSYSPKATTPVDGPLIPGVPTDAYAALGAGSQCCVIIPSLELVVVRTGDEPQAASLAGGSFVNELVLRAVSLP